MTTEPSTRGSVGAIILRLTVVLSALSAGWVAWSHQSSVNGWLFMGLGTSEAFAVNVERWAALVLLFSSLSLMWKPTWIACGLIFAWLLMLAVTTRIQAGEAFAYLAPASHAIRFVAPISLMLLHLGRSGLAFGFLRFAIAITFVAHGYEALQHHPQFIDLLIPSVRRQFGVRLREDDARLILSLIGCIDIALAAALCFRRWRWIAAYMAAWGAITLVSRMSAWGLERWPESATRLANFGAPLALYYYWRDLARVKPPASSR
ncbi:MAG: hypothetical protein ACI8X5_000541 [Planctomycetota bacterium]|jgi:hypothetical protein